MSAGPVNNGKGRKKAFNNDLNLVPFIDLFSVLIIFLLLTAVWDQLAAVKVNMGTEERAASQIPPDQIKKISSEAKIAVEAEEIVLFNEGKVSRVKIKSPTTGIKDFAPIDSFVAEIRNKFPEKKDMVITSTDNAVYEDLVAVMDKCLAKDFVELVVTGTN